MSEHFTMTNERAEEIAAVGGFTVEQVREFCLADWPEGEDHQLWLDTAPADEIAGWIEADGLQDSE